MNPRRGLALVGVLAILMIATLATTTLYMLTQDELLRTRTFLDATRARQAARTGMARMLAAMDIADGTPPAGLSGEIGGLRFTCSARDVAGEEYRKFDSGLSGRLVELTSVAGRVPAATEARMPVSMQITAVVDPAAHPPAIRFWVAEPQGKGEPR